MESLQELLDLAPVNVQLSQTKNPQGWKAQMAKESAAVFEIFSSGEFGNPAQGSFRHRSESHLRRPGLHCWGRVRSNKPGG